jgi:hypothetical protein
MQRRLAGRAAVVSYQPSWMEVALQFMVLVFAALLLTACTVQGPVRTQTALVESLSEEVSCMSECLDDDSETCDSCAVSCLQESRGDRVAFGL